MKEITLWDRLRYEFDNTLSRGPLAMMGWLSLLSAVVILVIAFVIAALGITPSPNQGAWSFAEAAWQTLMQTLGGGSMGSATGVFRIVTLVATAASLCVVGMLIGILTNSIREKIASLRKGRSLVAEKDHIVILGWSPQVFAILTELVTANANRPHACIAILAEKDKVEMEEQIRAQVSQTGHTRIVCRTGSPIDQRDLEIVNPHHARAIVILAPESTDPDSQVIKTMLAFVNNPNRPAAPYHIVAEMRHERNLDVARLVGRDEVQVVLTSNLISRIAVQTCRQSGLSVVYTELLDFGGDEFYFAAEPALVGKAFGEALLAYEDSSLVGLMHEDGRVQLNPPMDTRIEPGDQVIAISEDDDTIRLSGLAELPLEPDAIREPCPRAAAPERTLILGWNRRVPAIIEELGRYVAPGSEVLVVADAEGAEEAVHELGQLAHLAVGYRRGDTTNRHVLNRVGVADHQHVMVVSYSDTLSVQEADARTLITLLHLRDIVEKSGAEVTIVSEMLDVRNRDLAEATRADDFIVSDRLTSLVLTQLAENRRLGPVFEDLFDPQGTELYLKPAGGYVELGRPLSFYTVVEAARRRSEVAVGYRLAADAKEPAKAYGVVVNPDKSARITFAERDRIIVLAEE